MYCFFDGGDSYMYVTMEKIQGMSIIENPEPKNFGVISYDLRVDKIIFQDKEDLANEKDDFTLAPGNTVFVSTIENLKMPLNMVGIVTQRNSVIRRGLKVDAPVYHPGHHTKLFLRVTNISNADIHIGHENGIASIMFAELSDEVQPYKGNYVDEFDYKGVGNFVKDIPKSININKKIENIENIEKTLYEKVVALLTIFVGIFSLINLNVQFLNNSKSILQMLIYNLISIGGIGALVSFVGFIMGKKNKVSWLVLLFSIILIVVSILLVCKMS